MDDYSNYLSKQKVKSSSPITQQSLLQKRANRIRIFADVFKSLNVDFTNKKVLCLGARMGEEVEALKNMGANALGMDLVPYLPLVIEGDMNKLKMEDKYDIIYTNSMDHMYDVHMLMAGVHETLVNDGLFIAHICPAAFPIEKSKVNPDDIYGIMTEKFDLIFKNKQQSKLYPFEEYACIFKRKLC